MELAEGLADAASGDFSWDDNPDDASMDGRDGSESIQWTIDRIIAVTKSSWISKNTFRGRPLEIR